MKIPSSQPRTFVLPPSPGSNDTWTITRVDSLEGVPYRVICDSCAAWLTDDGSQCPGCSSEKYHLTAKELIRSTDSTQEDQRAYLNNFKFRILTKEEIDLHSLRADQIAEIEIGEEYHVWRSQGNSKIDCSCMQMDGDLWPLKDVIISQWVIREEGFYR